jgi:hypothetical protein
MGRKGRGKSTPLKRKNMLEIKTIVRDILKGKLTRDLDEKYAEGFYDLALGIDNDLSLGYKITTKHYLELTDAIYSVLWEVFEETKKQTRNNLDKEVLGLIKISLKTCPKCGEKYKATIEPKTGKKSKYDFYCDCSPREHVSIG